MSPTDQWSLVLQKFQLAQAYDPDRLKAEAQACGVLDQEREELDDLLLDLQKLDPAKALPLLAQQLPSLDLQNLADAHPYDVAVGLLRLFSPAEKT